MGKYYGVSLEDHYKAELCANCLYTRGCKRGLYPVYDEQTKTTTLKCEYYGRYNDEELS